MHRPKRIIRKLVVLAFGTPVLLLGIVLIPLPGPGLLLSLLGLIILSVEFEFAKKSRDIFVGKLKDLIVEIKAKNR